MALRDLGWLLGGTEGVMLIGYGERWYDEEMVRHEVDEPARHVMQDLIGEAGGAGPGWLADVQNTAGVWPIKDKLSGDDGQAPST